MLLDRLVTAYTELMSMMSSYPVAQAAVASSMGIAITAAVGFVVWKFPLGVWNAINAQCFTTLTFNSQGTSEWDTRQAKQFNALLSWLAASPWIRLSRSFTFNYVDGELVRGPGPGRHVFIRAWRLFILDISDQPVQGTTTTKYTVKVRMLGRSQAELYKFMDAFMVKEKTRPDSIPLYGTKSGDWEWVGRIVKRPKSTLILAPTVEEQIFAMADEYHKDPNWYRDRGINYKLTYLLYGEPGTGKSSIARVLASHYERPVYTLDLERCGSILAMFQRARGGVLLIEDIDTFDAAVSRISKATQIAKPNEVELTDADAPKIDKNVNLLEEFSKWGGLSLSALLNALDGVAGLDDIIIIMTTNHPERLDPALIRDSRVDLRVEIPRLTDAEIRRYVKLFFPNYTITPSVVFPSLPGATVQREFMLHKRDPEGFVQGLLEAKPITDHFKAA